MLDASLHKGHESLKLDQVDFFQLSDELFVMVEGAI